MAVLNFDMVVGASCAETRVASKYRLSVICKTIVTQIRKKNSKDQISLFVRVVQVRCNERRNQHQQAKHP